MARIASSGQVDAIEAGEGAPDSGDMAALVRGFAVASTDTGHNANTVPFSFSFMRDRQAHLDFAYLANAEVAGVAKKIIVQYYARSAVCTCFVGFSTGVAIAVSPKPC